jgi:hypothetical protein
MTPITETAAAAIASTRRKRLGDGMFTPERLLEYRDQVSADWWGYKERPELFRVVNRGDEVTTTRHRETLERTRRGIERQLGRAGTTTASAPAFRLPRSNPREAWRLP